MYDIGPNLLTVYNEVLGLIFFTVIVWGIVSIGRIILEWWKRR